MDWTELLNRSKTGDETARQKLFTELMVRLRPVVQSRLRGWSTMDHDDILQNTLLVVIERLTEIEENPQYYALNVLRNKIGDALRQRSSQYASMASDPSVGNEGATMLDNIAADNPDPGDEVDRQRIRARIVEAIKKMPKFCQLFFLAALEGKTVAEVWEHVQKSEPDLKRAAFDKRIFDCRKRMRQDLLSYIQS